MKKTLVLALTVAIATAFVGYGFAYAADAPKTVLATVTGKNLPNTAAKQNELKVTEAKGADGKAIADLAGVTLKYGTSALSKELAGGRTHETVTVVGNVDAAAKTIDVTKIEKTMVPLAPKK